MASPSPRPRSSSGGAKMLPTPSPRSSMKRPILLVSINRTRRLPNIVLDDPAADDVDNDDEAPPPEPLQCFVRVKVGDDTAAVFETAPVVYASETTFDASSQSFELALGGRTLGASLTFTLIVRSATAKKQLGAVYVPLAYARDKRRRRAWFPLQPPSALRVARVAASLRYEPPVLTLSVAAVDPADRVKRLVVACGDVTRESDAKAPTFVFHAVTPRDELVIEAMDDASSDAPIGICPLPLSAVRAERRHDDVFVLAAPRQIDTPLGDLHLELSVID